ncbi:MAG: dihydroorotase, partial [Halanaerobiaceae bacterium]
MKTLIENGKVFIDNKLTEINMLIENGKITARDCKEFSADRVLDVKGNYILPGAVDAHAHLTYPEGEETFYTGTCAAAAGGYTTVVDMNHPSSCTTKEDYVEKKEECSSQAVVDFGLCSGIAIEEEDLQELAELKSLGTPYLKLFMPLQPDYDYIYRTLVACKEAGIIPGIHAEDMQLIDHFSRNMNWQQAVSFVNSRPPVTEEMATAAILELARTAGTPVHFCHTSSAETAVIIKTAREERGIRATTEIQPHYLILDDSYFSTLGPYVKTTPPIRNRETKKLLWKQLQQGDIDFISSDHFYCPQQKKEEGQADIRRAPGGIPGIEHGFSLLYHYGVEAGKISLARLVELMSEKPARFCGMYPRKGSLKTSTDADFIIFDPEKEWTIRGEEMLSAAGYTPYEGWKIKGKVMKT